MDIATLQRLAGINEFKGFTPYEGPNISVTGTEKRKIEREKFASLVMKTVPNFGFPDLIGKDKNIPSGLRGRKNLRGLKNTLLVKSKTKHNC